MILMLHLSPIFCRQDMYIHLLFSPFTSMPSLASNNNASVFFFIVIKFSSNKLSQNKKTEG